MKVAILTPPRLGGPFYWARDLAMVLNGKGVKAEHIYNRGRLLQEALHQAEDVVHTTIPMPFGICRKPMVLTVKGDYTIEGNMWCRFYPDTIKRADAVTVPSEYLKHRLGIGQALVIPNAVMPERFDAVVHREQAVVNLVTVCNMYFKDKADGLVHLFNILRSDGHMPFYLTVVGDGAYRKYAEQQADGLDARFVGFIPDVRAELRKADIFVYYSVHDNFPNVLLEAMVMGIPVVTNKVGAVSEIIRSGQDGHIAEDDEDFMQALFHLSHSSALRQEMGTEARRTVESKFDWHKLVVEYIAVYRGLR